ncbi:MAG: alkaline phosphatase family protein [Phycisphaerae bacterium]|nr:alkaline phosphatase family protein [Phycisphaerae bacterium]
MSAVVAAVALLASIGGCDWTSGGHGAARGKQVLILGCDGMDPKLVGRMLDEGRLPNLAKLASEGGFCPLTTSIPPQSPVAWSNFITGAGPGVHGIFDFIHRDPKRHAFPYWSGNEIVAVEEKEPWPTFGEYQFPRIETKNVLLRHGTPFWEYLDERGIPVQMYRIPANYPPTVSKHGNARCLAGMGVPDALGNQGTYQHFSSKRRRKRLDGSGYKLRLRHDYKSGAYVGNVLGPPNDHKVKTPDLSVELKIYPDAENDVAKIIYVNEGLLGDDTVEMILSVGEWSDWQEVHFLKTPIGPTFRTIARFLLQEVRPEVRLYVSPINFDPTAPEAVFSEPADLVEDVAEEIGLFYTQGFAEEYNALKDGVFTDEEYRIQAAYVMEERFRLLDYALNHFEDGLLFFYFSSTDLQAHMFWWDSNEKHPVRSAEDSKKYNAVVENVYLAMDEALARCRKRLGEDATIIVMSDHGFGNFRRCVGVATWLRDEGYWVSTSDDPKGLYVDTDWTRTRAYSLGVGGSIYLNLKGRETDGIVDPSERDSLLNEMSAKLMKLVDPETGQCVLRRVYRADEWYHGPEVKNAPDLLLGYERGYRASWATGLGDFDDAVIVDNTNAWSADHCIAHDLVPGILVTNRQMTVDDPALIDVGPTVLAEFGISTPDGMTGHSIFEPPGERLSRRNKGR